jgi:hypothetical protein
MQPMDSVVAAKELRHAQGPFPGIHVLAKVERGHGRDKPGHDEKEKSESLFQVVQERLKISAAFSVILCGR